MAYAPIEDLALVEFRTDLLHLNVSDVHGMVSPCLPQLSVRQSLLLHAFLIAIDVQDIYSAVVVQV